MEFISKEDVLVIHSKVTAFARDIGDPVDPPGIKNIATLESAVARQSTGWGEQLKYPDARQNAASLMYGICLGHAFHNGNKRTALLSGMLHLDKNGYCFEGTVKHDQIYDFVKGMAAHEWREAPIPKFIKKKYPMLFMPISKGVQQAEEEVKITGDWLREFTRTADRRERSLNMRVLRSTLTRLGVTADRKNTSIVFSRQISKKGRFGLFSSVSTLTYTLPYQGEGRPVNREAIKKLRQALHLSVEDGCDSVSFYDQGTVLDEMLVNYQNLIKRLGKI